MEVAYESEDLDLGEKENLILSDGKNVIIEYGKGYEDICHIFLLTLFYSL